MSDPRLEACPSCAPSRAAGELVDCRDCKKTGFRRKLDTWLCNLCGNTLLPIKWDGTRELRACNAESPDGLIEARVSGHYDSTYLSDCTTYEFSFCERCLRELFNRCKIPPKLSDYMHGGEGESYEHDRQWSDFYLWRARGGQDAKFLTGLCNANEACPRKATRRKIHNDYPSDEAYCDECEGMVGSNEYLVPAELLAGIAQPTEATQWSILSLEDARRVAEAVIPVVRRPGDVVTYWRWAPRWALDAVGLTGKKNSRLSAIYVPNTCSVPAPFLGANHWRMEDFGIIRVGKLEDRLAFEKAYLGHGVLAARIFPRDTDASDPGDRPKHTDLIHDGEADELRPSHRPLEPNALRPDLSVVLVELVNKLQHLDLCQGNAEVGRVLATEPFCGFTNS